MASPINTSIILYEDPTKTTVIAYLNDTSQGITSDCEISFQVDRNVGLIARRGKTTKSFDLNMNKDNIIVVTGVWLDGMGATSQFDSVIDYYSSKDVTSRETLAWGSRDFNVQCLNIVFSQKAGAGENVDFNMKFVIVE